MSDIPRFKLLFLPSLTYEAIVQKMNVREQYNLATLSKKMQRGVGSSNRIAVVTCIARFSGDQLYFAVTHKTTRSKFVFRLRPNKWDDHISLAKDQMMFLNNSLRLQSVEVMFSLARPARMEFDFIEFLKHEKLKIHALTCFSIVGVNDEWHEYLLEEGKNVSELSIYLISSPNFRTTDCPVFSLDKFSTNPGNWLTVDTLIANFMNCKEIDSGSCHFTLEQLNPFIKKWTEGSRIEELSVRLNSVSQFESIVNGIDATEIRQAYTTHGHESFEPNECFLIEQSSGVKALLYTREHYVFLRKNFSLDSPLAAATDRPLAYTCDYDEEPEHGKDEERDEVESEFDDEEESDDSYEDDREDSESDDEASEEEEEEEDGESDE